MAYKSGDKAMCRGQVVEVQRSADSNGLRYFVRFPDGNAAGVRGADLTPATPEQVKGVQFQNAVYEIPPAYVGLQKNIVAFDPRNFPDFAAILSMGQSLGVVDPNVMAKEMRVTGSTLYNWTKGALRPPNHVMVEAVAYIKSHISAAIVDRREEDRLQLQQRLQSPDEQRHLTPEEKVAKSVGGMGEAVAEVQVLTVGSSSYSVEIRQNGDLLEATSPQVAGLKVTADNRVDMMIDLKRLLLAKQAGVDLPQLGDVEEGSPVLPETTTVVVPPLPPARAAAPVEPSPTFKARLEARAKEIEDLLAENAKAAPPAPPPEPKVAAPRPPRPAPDASDAMDILLKIDSLVE